MARRIEAGADPTDSHAMQFLTLAWERNCKRSWECINHTMHDALKVAVDGGFEFAADDVQTIYERWRASRWIGKDGLEWFLAMAVAVDNKTAIAAIDKFLDRTPIIADDVKFSSGSRTLHNSGGTSVARGRLVVGATFTFGDSRPTVTSLNGETATACTYKGDRYSGKIEKRLAITKANIIADRAARKAAAKEREAARKAVQP